MRFKVHQDDQSVVGIGFEPKFVMVASVDSAWGSVYRFSSQTGDKSFIGGLDVAETSSGIQSFTSDGFTIGDTTWINAIDEPFKFMVFGGDEAYIETGVFTGDTNDGRKITVNGTPTFVWLKNGVQDRGAPIARTSAFSVDTCISLGGNIIGDALINFGSNYFEVNASAVANDNGRSMYWLAIKGNPSFYTDGRYKGDNTDNRDISIDENFNLQWLMIDRDGSSYTTWSDDSETDYSYEFRQFDNGPNKIQSFGTGTFQIGQNPSVNAISTKYFYYWGVSSFPGLQDRKGFDGFEWWNRFER